MTRLDAMTLARVLTFCFVSVCAASKNGLRAESFRGIPHLTQLECSAEPIESDADLFSMMIFRHSDGVIIASVRPWQDECLTSSSFSSCHVDRRNVRHTRLASIVSLSEYAEYEYARYGCNITYELKRSGTMRKETWNIALQTISSVHRVTCKGSTAYE